jgi:hypothetical protein
MPRGRGRASRSRVCPRGGLGAQVSGRPERPRRGPPRPRRAGTACVARRPHAETCGVSDRREGLGDASPKVTAGSSSGAGQASHLAKGPRWSPRAGGRGGETCEPEAVQRAHGRAGAHGNGSARCGGGPGAKARQRPRPRPTQSALPLPAAGERWRSAAEGLIRDTYRKEIQWLSLKLSLTVALRPLKRLRTACQPFNGRWHCAGNALRHNRLGD